MTCKLCSSLKIKELKDGATYLVIVDSGDQAEVNGLANRLQNKFPKVNFFVTNKSVKVRKK